MTIPAPKVEIGFDLVGANAPFLTLDDPVKGKLNDANYPLSGTIFYDVTDKMVEISVGRGKNRVLDQYDVGLAQIVLQNNDRTFDPTFSNSPYFGQIIPKRALRISAGTALSFVGVVDDWGFLYEPNGQSVATISASDAFSYFNEQTLPEITNTVGYAGERINEILDRPDVNWPQDKRSIDTGIQELTNDTIAEDTNVLNYFKQIAASEPGSFFISREGDVVFQDRRTVARSGNVVLADDGTGIPYVGMRIQYGSELLYNEIVIGAASGTAVAFDAESQAEYGVLNFTQTGLLINNLSDVETLAGFYASKFSQPEYRFESVDIQLDELPEADQQAILALDASDVVQIKFTPNGIAPAIEKYAEIIRISHAVTTTSHVVSLGFSTLDFAVFVLDDQQFGKLDSGNALAF